MTELKPCPFCGGAAELKTREYAMVGHKQQAYVICKTCGVTSAYFSENIAYCANEKAIEAWNRRLKMTENELQKIIKRIFNHIKEKYGYTDEQTLIYLQGYQDCAKENQQSLEKRDKMLRDTVAELCEAKRLLKEK